MWLSHHTRPHEGWGVTPPPLIFVLPLPYPGPPPAPPPAPLVKFQSGTPYT